MKISFARLLVGVGIFFLAIILSLFLRFLLTVIMGPVLLVMSDANAVWLFWALQIIVLIVVGVLIWKKKDSVIYMLALILGFLASFAIGPMN